MNALLWILQVVLAIKFLSVAYTHAVRPDPAKMQRGRERFGAAARPLLLLIGLGAFLGGVALVLPAATGILPGLTPWVAALLALMMLAAAALHPGCRENSKTVVSLLLFLLAAVVAWGRWFIAPL